MTIKRSILLVAVALAIASAGGLASADPAIGIGRGRTALLRATAAPLRVSLRPLRSTRQRAYKRSRCSAASCCWLVIRHGAAEVRRCLSEPSAG